MKILRVINSLETGGAERSIATNVPMHISNGYEMDVLLLKGVDTHFKKELERKGVRIFHFGKNNNIYSPLNIFKIIPYLKKYDIVHGHLFPTLYWLALAKLISFSKTPLIFTEHNTFNRRKNFIFLIWLDKLVYKLFKVIICVSNAAKEDLVNLIGLRESIRVINNGTDIAALEKEIEHSIKETEIFNNNKVLLMIASFRVQKDQDTLIRSLKFLPENFVAVFLGEGERLEICKQLTKDLGLEKRTFFLGVQQHVGAYISQSFAVVMSSHWEGFGRAAVEAMALSKPVIASNVPGLADVVGRKDMLFPVGDEKKLAEIVMKLESDPEFYNEVCTFNKERAKEFSVEKMIAGYEAVYEEVFQTYCKKRK